MKKVTHVLIDHPVESGLAFVIGAFIQWAFGVDTMRSKTNKQEIKERMAIADQKTLELKEKLKKELGQ